MTTTKVSMKGEIELPVEIHRKYGIDAAVGFFHNFSRIAFFLFAIVLVLIYARVFKLKWRYQ